MGGGKACHKRVAVRAVEQHAALNGGIQMCFVRIHEPDICSAQAEVGSEHTAGCAGSDHCYFHVVFSLFMTGGLITTAMANAKAMRIMPNIQAKL